MLKAKTIHRPKHLFSIIVLLLIALLIAIPLLIAIINTFKPRQEILLTPLSINFSTLTLENIKATFLLMNYPRSFYNTVIILVLSSALMVAMGSLMGFAVGILQNKLMNTLYVATILVITIPFISIMIPIVIILNRLQWINTYFGTSIVHVATSLPVVVFLYTGFMKSIPRELCDAAVVDGCGMWRTYWKIYFPLMKNITSTVLIIRGTAVWNDLIISRITITDASRATLIYKLYTFVSSRFNRWDIVFAATLLSSLPIIIIFVIMQRRFVQGAISGAVKG